MPFTAEQFFQVFEKYNQSVFPVQIVLILAALAAVVLTSRPKSFSNQLVSFILAFFWLWAGVVYHLIFFTEINPAAYVFSALFVAQSMMLFDEGIVKKRLSFCPKRDLYGILGAIFIVYALVFYPVVGIALGRVYPASPTFGAPCPMVIFTFGLLMWTDKKLPRHLLIIPVLWTFVAASAALTFGVKEDFGLLIAGTIAIAFIVWRDFSPESEEAI